MSRRETNWIYFCKMELFLSDIKHNPVSRHHDFPRKKSHICKTLSSSVYTHTHTHIRWNTPHGKSWPYVTGTRKSRAVGSSRVTPRYIGRRFVFSCSFNPLLLGFFLIWFFTLTCTEADGWTSRDLPLWTFFLLKDVAMLFAFPGFCDAKSFV